MHTYMCVCVCVCMFIIRVKKKFCDQFGGFGDCVVNFKYFVTRPFGQASSWYDTSESGVFCLAGQKLEFLDGLEMSGIIGNKGIYMKSPSGRVTKIFC